MKLEKNLMDLLIDYLKSHGYPEKSFAIEYNTGKYFVDLAIVDPDSKLPIMIFEVKSKPSDEMKKLGILQIKKILRDLGDIEIPAYLVDPLEKSPYFKTERVYLKKNKKYKIDQNKENDSFFNYNFQKQSRNSERIANNTKKREEVVDDFKFVCWTIAFIILVLIVIFRLFKFTLNTIELSSIALIIALIVAPYASKLKFLGIEFERLKKGND